MIPMMNEYKNLIINFVKEHQKGLKIALLVFLVGGMIFKGLMQIPQINASKAEVAKLTNQIEYEQERQKEIEELKKYWDINNSRLSIFNTTTFVSSFAVLAPITAPTGPAINPPAIDLLIVPFLFVIVFSPIVSIL